MSGTTYPAWRISPNRRLMGSSFPTISSESKKPADEALLRFVIHRMRHDRVGDAGPTRVSGEHADLFLQQAPDLGAEPLLPFLVEAGVAQLGAETIGRRLVEDEAL